MIAFLRPFFKECGGVPVPSPTLLIDFDDRKGFFDLAEGFFKLGEIASQGRGKPPELADDGVGSNNSMWSVCIIRSIHSLGSI